MSLQLEAIKEFIRGHKDERIFLFGFTFMIWQYFYEALVKIKEESGQTLDLSNAVMIHGGGWKKLASLNISTERFNSSLEEICGIKSVHDYYGMVE